MNYHEQANQELQEVLARANCLDYNDAVFNAETPVLDWEYKWYPRWVEYECYMYEHAVLSERFPYTSHACNDCLIKDFGN
jgi:hypothetical protein